MENLSIREIIDSTLRGQIRVPAFQRGFVWEPDRVAYLMDSIYKEYPFGALLFWRTKEQLKAERKLGPFSLPTPKEDYPVDYILDGQQRLTSIFAVFQNELNMESSDNWKDIYFDFTAVQNPQSSMFLALADGEADPNKHFPLRAVFDTATYRKATALFDEPTARKIDEMQAVFKELRLPVQIFKTEDKATVSIIFERINRQGVRLDTIQLLSAWTWSEDFQLQTQFTDLSDELKPFGFEDVGVEENLLLRCCAAIFASDASPEALITLNGEIVRKRFDEVVNGVKGAIDFLRSHLNVQELSNLPFQTVIVPLSVFFASSGDKEIKMQEAQRKQIHRWFWRTCFSKRYSSGVLRNLKSDIEEMKKLRETGTSSLGDFTASVNDTFFTENKFGMGSVNTKTFILMLANNRPLSFISGAPLDLAGKLRLSNRTEFHHLMPRAFLETSKQGAGKESSLANMCFLSRADNREVGGVAPSQYKKKLPADVTGVLESAVCPDSLFNDKFDSFIAERANRLTHLASALMT